MKIMKSLKGKIRVPGDKSISHRAVMFGALSNGTTEITGFLPGADCRSTIACFRQMGIEIETQDLGSGTIGDHVKVHGKGLGGLTAPAETLYTGNSGTTTRIISGILSGQSFESRLTGDSSIEKRPMKRVMEPLSLMGADIRSERDNGCAPLIIRPASLHGITYESPVASAQVKSAVLLAGLYAEGPTTVTEPALSRNHTELMLSAFGADIRTGKQAFLTAETDVAVNRISRGLAKGAAKDISSGIAANTVTIVPGNTLHGQKVEVPGDISSAAYFLTAALITPGSDILIENVNINPTRAGILEVYRAMGGNIELMNERTVSGEAVADLHVIYSSLHGTTVEGTIIPALIDELPVIAIAAAFADGKTIVRDAAELKVKESNRIEAVTEGLSAMGGNITPTDDGFIIEGGAPLHPAAIRTYDDHRIAMSFYTATLPLGESNTLNNPDCAVISYPDFYSDMESLLH